MSNTKFVHTCYGCEYYHQIREPNGTMSKYPYKNCGIINHWECEIFNGTMVTKKKEVLLK